MYNQFNNNNLVNEINYFANIIYFNPCMYTRGIALNELMNRVSALNNLDLTENSKVLGAVDIGQRTFTIDELLKLNGRDGNLAYIAVNGVVYDVTNNAVWAAATHFGLSAGKDLTNEFASCHSGQQQILNKLPVVGRLI